MYSLGVLWSAKECCDISICKVIERRHIVKNGMEGLCAILIQKLFLINISIQYSVMRKANNSRLLPPQRRLLLDQQFKKQAVELSDTNLQDEDIKYCQTKVVKYIKRLELNHNQLTQASMKAIQPLKWQSLAKIQLMSNQIGNKGCKYLSGLNCQTIQTLFLNNNKISGQGVMHLCKKKWSKLQTIVLYFNRIGELGLHSLLKANWQRISSLHLSYNQIDLEKKNLAILGEWKNIHTLNIAQQQDENGLNLIANRVAKKFPRIKGFNTVIFKHVA